MRRPRSLRARLLLANLVVAGAALGTVVVAVSFVGPGYFADAMGHLADDPMGRAMDAATRAAFSDAVRNALVAAGLIAVVTSIAVSLALSSAIAGPVGRLAAAARRIAKGHYAERVPEEGEGEFGDLARSFNAMTRSLEEIEHRRLQLVGDVAHELRTPLATVDGYLEGLEDGVIAPTSETWRLLRGETARLTRLVSDLQELWRAEAWQLPLSVEPVDPAVVTGEVVERFVAQAAGRGIAIEADLPSGLTVRADHDRLGQIVANFLSNAIRYGPAGSVIGVTACRRGSSVEVAVRDEGPGLSADQRTRVFERFYRIDPSRSRALGGSGIGLAIARALAEAMGGSVRADSDGPGTGSTFLVALPDA
ncbi:MAG TPA: ATP-binding protein [Candidatus Limnocylindria bacterium]|nr:ATP-binding protein [Candidatus Limnocylindria bacterium]